MTIKQLLTTSLLFVSSNLPILHISHQWNHMWHFCLASFTCNIFKIHVVIACIYTSFFCVISILLHVCTTVCLFIHLLMDIYVVSTFLLLLNSSKYFPAMIWVPVLNLGVIYLGVEFLGHMDIFEKSRNWTFKQCIQEICVIFPQRKWQKFQKTEWEDLGVIVQCAT